jgi:hypothetical protein
VDTPAEGELELVVIFSLIGLVISVFLIMKEVVLDPNDLVYIFLLG